MPYVERSAGSVVGLYNRPQPGYAEELLADSDPEVLAYLAARSPGGSAQTVESRAAAVDLVADDRGPLAKLFRAVAAVLTDEINLIRARLRAQDAAVAAATSLADLKTRWAALSAMPDRTLAQAKQALKGKVNGGTVD